MANRKGHFRTALHRGALAAALTILTFTSSSMGDFRAPIDKIAFKKGTCPGGSSWTVSSSNQDICCPQGTFPSQSIGKETTARCASPQATRGSHGSHHSPKMQFVCAGQGPNAPFRVWCPIGMTPTCEGSSKKPQCDYAVLDSVIRKDKPSVASALDGEQEAQDPDPIPTPWCENGDDVNPPDDELVQKCFDDLMQTPLGKCLAKLVGQTEKSEDWPTQKDMEKCGCEFSHIDEQTGAAGRKLYICRPPELRVSPFNEFLGIMNLDYPGCMFDWGLDDTGEDSGPRDSDNCFSCHRRDDPEVADPVPCEETPVASPSPTPLPTLTPTKTPITKPTVPAEPTPKRFDCSKFSVSRCYRDRRNRVRSKPLVMIRSECRDALKQKNRGSSECLASCVRNTLRRSCSGNKNGDWKKINNKKGDKKKRRDKRKRQNRR
jgi:hypothetical protein